MKSRAITLIILAALSIIPAMKSEGASQKDTLQNSPAYVYICTGPSSVCYHSTPDCSGLNRCSGDKVKITLEKAKKMGRRACRKCCQ